MIFTPWKQEIADNIPEDCAPEDFSAGQNVLRSRPVSYVPAGSLCVVSQSANRATVPPGSRAGWISA